MKLNYLFFEKRNKKNSLSKIRANNQPKFRSDVFKYYENECAVCGLNLFLDAAHIIPVEKNGTDNKENGLNILQKSSQSFR